MNDFFADNLYWLAPVVIGLAIIVWSRLRFPNFFWRITSCVVPIVLATIVVTDAWIHFGDREHTGYRFNLGVDLAGGTILVYEVDQAYWDRLVQEGRQASYDSAKLAEVLKRRVDPNNLLEITIRPISTEPPRVEVILPVQAARGGVQDVRDIERIKSIISQVGKLEFRILADIRDANGPQVFAQARSDVSGFTINPGDTKTLPPSSDPDYAWVEVAAHQAEENGWNEKTPEGFAEIPMGNDAKLAAFHASKAGRHFLLTRIPPPTAQVTGEDIIFAERALPPGYSNWVVRFSLSPEGADKFWELTEPVGHYMAIILDEKIESYPVLNDRLSDGGIITMGGSDSFATVQQKVDDLVRVLRAGSLPAVLNPEPASEFTMGPSLGRDTIRKGTIAIIVALIGVIAFMCVYYRFAGLVASVALTANLILTVGFMVAVQAAFTLPGLAGLVLMLGMAVDANVLIYERIREERDRGASLALAIRNGYARAFPTIMDTHLTSIFTAIVLYTVGTDQLKGFGISLTVGLIISLFTALYMTRVIFDLFLSKRWLKELKMFRFFTKPNIDFMRVRNYWFTTTVVLSLFGLAVFIYRGEDGLNIDFTGGTAYTVEFKHPMDIETVRGQITNSELPNPAVDALYPEGTGYHRDDSVTEGVYPGYAPGGSLTPVFTFRTTLRDRTKVRQIVANTFDEDLVWVEVKAGPIENAQIEDFDKQVQLSFHYRTIAEEKITIGADEVARNIDSWYAELGVAQPERFYRVTELEAEDTGGSVQVAFVVPAGRSPDELVTYLTAKNGPLYQPVSWRLENFDSQLAAEIQGTALAAIALSWLAICGYLWFRFGNWTFGLAAVLCLLHDLMFTIGLIGVSHYLVVYTPIGSWLLLDDFKLDLPAVAALLTLIGYSVNDTIVVFDRIREVRGKSPDLTPKMINDSINQTLSRSVITSVVVFLVVFILYVAGGEGIHLFSFVMVVGVIVGSYSSIFVASPLLLILGEGRQRETVRGRVQPQATTV